jgi:hypothetical protein
MVVMTETVKKVAAGQNTTVIPCGYVDPNKLSNTQVGPGFYSLNKRSNVPFVGLIGSAGFRKVISWGEIAEIPCGQLVTISNASFHGGDIFINKGPDMCNRPSRITVPVPFTFGTITTGEGDEKAWNSTFPCDTRAAKRAYLNVDARVNLFNLDGDSGAPLTAFIRGRRLDGSMKTENSLAQFAAPFGPGVGFLSAISIPVSTDMSYIPLGQGASFGDDTRPHNLLDAGDIFFLLGIQETLADRITWPASSDIFGFPPGQAPAPGTWYVIEYD